MDVLAARLTFSLRTKHLDLKRVPMHVTSRRAGGGAGGGWRAGGGGFTFRRCLLSELSVGVRAPTESNRRRLRSAARGDHAAAAAAAATAAALVPKRCAAIRPAQLHRGFQQRTCATGARTCKRNVPGWHCHTTPLRACSYFNASSAGGREMGWEEPQPYKSGNIENT
ncbi:unnamed protein product [Lampetra fluviatilis]